jgi:hypothetical protein
MLQISRRTRLGPVTAIGVIVMVVAACSNGQVETTAPTSSVPGVETSTLAPTSTVARSTTVPTPTTSLAPVGPARPPAAVDVVGGTPGWFVAACDKGLSLLRPDGVAVPVVDRAVSNAVAASAESIYFQYEGQPGISLVDLRTGRVEPAIDAPPGEQLVLHGLAEGSRGPLPPERWLYYERIAANGDRRLTRWRPGTGLTADLGLIATAGDRVGRISYLKGRDFLMIVERAGRREFKAVGWDGEPRGVDPEPGSCTSCLPFPCAIATMGCHHLAIGSGRALVVWVERIEGRQELVFVQMSPIASEPHREGLPEGTVVDELLLRGSQVIVNTRLGDRAGPALLFDADSKGGYVVESAARLSWTDDDQLTSLPVATGGDYVFRRSSQLWLLDAGGTRLLDDGPVGAFRAGPDHSVFFERIVDRAAGKRQEIWRVDVNTGAKTLVLPVPASEFDNIHLVAVAQIDGRHRLGYSRFERPPGATGEFNGQEVMYLTSLDGTEAPVRVTAVGGNEWGVDIAGYANGWFVGTRSDIQAVSPAAFGVHGEAPSAMLIAALRCQHVCDGSYGSSCSTTNGLGCGFGHTISPDGKRLAWIESSHGAVRSPLPVVVGHDLVVVDAETGAELQRSFIPTPTLGGYGTVSWLGSDRLLVSITRSTSSNALQSVKFASFIAQLTERGAEFRRLVLPEADSVAPVPL